MSRKEEKNGPDFLEPVFFGAKPFIILAEHLFKACSWGDDRQG
jgi:hypothetical protein